MLSPLNVATQFPANGCFAPTKRIGNRAVSEMLFLQEKDLVAFFLSKLRVMFFWHTTLSILPKAALLN